MSSFAGAGAFVDELCECLYSPLVQLEKLDTTCTEGDCELGEASKLAVLVPLSMGMIELKRGGGGCAQTAAIATAAHYAPKSHLRSWVCRGV